MTTAILTHLTELVPTLPTFYPEGKVTKVVGLTVETEGPDCIIGELCRVRASTGDLLCEVIGFRDNRNLLMPLGRLDGLKPGAPVLATRKRLTVPVGSHLLGRVLDGLGRPISEHNSLAPAEQPLAEVQYYPVVNDPPPPMSRGVIKDPLPLGIRSIDALLTVGRGQRLGIFAGSGVGKSTLLGMIARNMRADVAVIGLIGERGREVRQFLEIDLGPAGRQRSVVVAATSDQPPLLRIKAAHVATAIAEYYRDQGAHVVLLMDSITRFAMAMREVGLAAGEPPTARGYTPTVFAELPRLVERAGPTDQGSITAFYTVLVEGDDLTEPITDAVRGLLDGHLVLSRELASRGHYPAIDVLESVSRLMPMLVDKKQQTAAALLRRLLAAYREGRDLVEIGAYQQGTNPLLDAALQRLPQIEAFLQQGIDEKSTFDEAISGLHQLVAGLGSGG